MARPGRDVWFRIRAVAGMLIILVGVVAIVSSQFRDQERAEGGLKSELVESCTDAGCVTAQVAQKLLLDAAAADKVKGHSEPKATSKHPWSSKIKEIESTYAKEVNELKEHAVAKEKAEEKAMLAKMESYHDEEQKKINQLRVDEEKKETVILAEKKAQQIENTIRSVEEAAAKKTSKLNAKLNALHHLASALMDKQERTHLAAVHHNKHNAMAADKEAKEAKAMEVKKEAADIKKEALEKKEKLAEEKEQKAAAITLKAEVDKLKAERVRVEDKVQGLEKQVAARRKEQAEAEEKHEKQEHAMEKHKETSIHKENLSHKSGDVECTDTHCPLAVENDNSISDMKVIHRVSSDALVGHGEKKKQAMAFVKNLQAKINQDFKHVIGFGLHQEHTAERVFSGEEALQPRK